MHDCDTASRSSSVTARSGLPDCSSRTSSSSPTSRRTAARRAELGRRRWRVLRRRLRLRPLTKPRPLRLRPPSSATRRHDRGGTVGGVSSGSRARSGATGARVPARRGTHAGRLRRRRPNADLMFVGEAPGFHEDKQGSRSSARPGKLLDPLLAGIGLDTRRTSTSRTSSSAARPEPRPAARRDRGLRAATSSGRSS